MSLRTTATPLDFTYFIAWYGVTPSFSERSLPSYKWSCSDEWYLWRVAGINSFSLPRLHHADPKQLSNLWSSSLQDLIRCYKIKWSPLAERPTSWASYFREKYPMNDVWEYHKPPTDPYYTQ